MRILTWQNAVLVSLAAAGVALGACSSSDVVRPGTAGASATTAGSNAGGAGNTAGAPTTGGGAPSVAGMGSAGTPVVGGAGMGTAGAAGPSVCDGLGSRLLDATMPADAFIDDAEKAQAAGPDAVAGGWYGFNDVMPTGNAIQPKRVAGGATTTPTTMFAIQYSGMGAKTPVAGGYGVGLEINVGIAKDLMPPQYCVDASAFKGVSFWAKANGLNKMISVGFVVPSQNQVKNGGDCGDDLPPAKCNNYPQKNFTLTDTWAQYFVDFEGLKGSTGATVVAGKVQQVLWLAPTKDWDFSVDEVAFYTTASMAPVAPPPAAP